MWKQSIIVGLVLLLIVLLSCNKKEQPVIDEPFNFSSAVVDNRPAAYMFRDVSLSPTIRLTFTSRVNRASVTANVNLQQVNVGNVLVNISYDNDSTIVLQPSTALTSLSKYMLVVSDQLLSVSGKKLSSNIQVQLFTGVDLSDKFSRISDSALVTLVQNQTFKYFWDFGHPVCGLARERNTSGDVVTTGGSGFGIMAIITGVNRGFITRQQGLTRLTTIVDFLKNSAQRFHGAFPHWMNGVTGVVIPFSQKDNGGDLVETSFLMEGLLCARQYFNGSDVTETGLRDKINELWQGVEWNWYTQNQKVLYWHWSPTYNWDMNFPIKGWNEALITYVLAASSPKFSITKDVYDNGWASNGGIRNGNNYYGITLPLGPAYGGPLFFAHYSFMGINPTGLQDAYANYFTQNQNHTLINYTYCKTNPQSYSGYSDSCWGLTASDDFNGYKAHSPTNDDGVISPTAALSSFPYTPAESMKALRFFYYKLGDKLWGSYGFYDAFSLQEPWFATSTLAIDQGPIVVMIENYRSGLLWQLFTSCPEVKAGMKMLGFTAPYL